MKERKKTREIKKNRRKMNWKKEISI